MRDINFEFSSAPNRMSDRVQRYAVLHPLTRICRSPSDIIRQTTRLVDMWRARTSGLKNARWVPNPAARGNWLDFARNCYPTFAISGSEARSCKLTICPFCHARWVREVWLAVSGAFPKLTDGPCRYHLVEYWMTYAEPYSVDGCDDYTRLGQLLRKYVEWRKRHVSHLDPSGAMLFTTVEPSQDGWLIRIRHLLQVSADHELPTVYGSQPNCRLRRHEQPTRDVIAKAVARACTYPIGWMRGDVTKTAMLLDVRRQTKSRMSAMYRNFRSRTVR